MKGVKWYELVLKSVKQKGEIFLKSGNRNEMLDLFGEFIKNIINKWVDVEINSIIDDLKKSNKESLPDDEKEE